MSLKARPRIAALVLVLTAPALAGQQEAPSPEEHFGFSPGADRRLLTWEELCTYYRRVAAASPRVRYRVLGTTTAGRDMVLLLVGPRDAGRLEEVRRTQRALALGGLQGDPLEHAVETQPVVVYIQATLHSTEIGASCMLPHLVHELADPDPGTAALLEKVMVLIVPSANPDGQDLVVDWYRRTLNTPWEGTSPPRLYHRYAGHDNNRDWYMLSLKETRLLSRLLYRRWYPRIVLDIHQMGSRGARMFVPPYTDPLTPNVPASVSRITDLAGTHMAVALSRAGRTGVVQDVTFDNWWHGGARSVPARHNMLGILTETASVRLASPIFLPRSRLRGHGRGLPSYRRRGNFPEPWPGGWWRLADVVAYQHISSRALLRFAAGRRRDLVRSFHDAARRQIRLGTTRAPYGFRLPAVQPDRGAVRRLVANLVETGVRVHRVTAPGGRTDFIVPAAQAFRPHLKDLLEAQRYPELRTERGGPVIRPYDASGWTLPYQFGVDCHPLPEPPDPETLGAPLEEPPAPRVTLPAAGQSPGSLLLAPEANGAFTLVNRALRSGVTVLRERGSEGGAFHLLTGDPVAAGLDLGRLDADLEAGPPHPPVDTLRPLTVPRVGLLQTWPPSMDAGWTRLVLEEHGFAPRMLSVHDLRAGDLAAKLDALVIPHARPRTLREGAGPDRLPPAYQGGLGIEGARALRAFARAGGKVLAFGSAVGYLIDALGLPVRRVDPGKEVVAPGSLLRARVADNPPSLVQDLAAGLPPEPAVYVRNPRVLEATEGGRARMVPVLVYPRGDLLLSGYLQGGGRLAGRCLMAAVPVGRGLAVLYAFRPQHRSQTLGTFPLIFNALLPPSDREEPR